MTTVQDILAFIQTIAPHHMKMDWDNVGLLCGNGKSPVKKILVAMDPFESVCREAVDMGADLLITHHPLIFSPIKCINDSDSVGRRILMLCNHGISAINAHTNLDCAPGGVNDVLAAKLGLENVEIINPTGTDEQGRPYGLLRRGTVPVQNLEAFLRTVKNALGNDTLRYSDGGHPVHHVAVGGGSCGGAVEEVIAAGCDTFVTADIKYNTFRHAQEQGLTMIDAGHFHTENPACLLLAEKVAAAFPEITVKISESHRDCMKFY